MAGRRQMFTKGVIPMVYLNVYVDVNVYANVGMNVYCGILCAVLLYCKLCCLVCCVMLCVVLCIVLYYELSLVVYCVTLDKSYVRGAVIFILNYNFDLFKTYNIYYIINPTL